MTRRSILFLLARLCAGAFTLLSAVYCLLAYLPFTYHQVHVGGLLPWLTSFARLHAFLYWPAFAAAALTLPDLRNDRTRSWSVLFVAVYGAFGVHLLFHPVLPYLGNDERSLGWALASLTPLVWIAALDWAAQHGNLTRAVSAAADAHRLFTACLFSAVYLCVLSTTLSTVRLVSGSPGMLGGRQWVLAIACSLAAHLAVFMGVFLALNFVRTAAHLVTHSAEVQCLSLVAVAGFFASFVLKQIVFVPLSFSGAWANVAATSMGFSLVGVGSGTCVRLYRSTGTAESPFEILFAPARFLRGTSQIFQTALLLAASAGACYELIRASQFDWGQLVQKLLMLTVWGGTFVFFYMNSARSSRVASDRPLVLASAIVGLCLAGLGLQARGHVPRVWALSAQPSGWLDQYANFDVGLRLAQTVLSPPPSAVPDESLYGFLARNTNIPRSVRTEPVDIKLVKHFTPTAGTKPHIFIFVIDSLRRDYLSPYNTAVNFTPAIQAFAGENIVVKNAFTRYAGTGLSEPSIWAGAMLPHKQYVTPFAPMNSLEKLLQAEGYKQFITKDEILTTILGPTPEITELDAGRPTMSCELCQSLQELESRIDENGATTQPMFVYSQPQDLHISVLDREGRSVPAREHYPGFDEAYAARVRQVDACFGKFIQFLKDQGLYDNSIVVLTSDHGDSLGEEGHWGHAYNMAPEVVRIPLLMHVPPALRTTEPDEREPAFLIDIVPSLYALLGQTPLADHELFGRSLFKITPGDERRKLPDEHLIVSSYAPVYGLLRNHGRSLYVVDGIAYQDSLYEWDEAGQVHRSPVTPEVRAKLQQELHRQVQEISDFYGLDGGERLSARSLAPSRR